LAEFLRQFVPDLARAFSGVLTRWPKRDIIRTEFRRVRRAVLDLSPTAERSILPVKDRIGLGQYCRYLRAFAGRQPPPRGIPLKSISNMTSKEDTELDCLLERLSCSIRPRTFALIASNGPTGPGHLVHRGTVPLGEFLELQINPWEYFRWEYFASHYPR